MPRLSPFTKGVLWIGAGAIALWLAQPVLPLCVLGETLLSLYAWTSLSCLLQVRAVFSRSRANERQSRTASDATWYLPIYIWGIESNLDIVNVSAGDGSPWMVAPQQAIMLLVTLGVCFGTEAWARRRGAPSRAALGAVPRNVPSSAGA